jgi:hypothetical protein
MKFYQNLDQFNQLSHYYYRQLIHPQLSHYHYRPLIHPLIKLMNKICK